MDKPSNEMCQEWAQHPVTKWLLLEIEEAIADTLKVGFNSFLNSTTEFEAMRNSMKSRGMEEAFNMVCDVIEEMTSKEELYD